MADTLFTKIIRGEIPAYKIYEDEKTYAFLDINPVQPGHTLVIPKNPKTFMWDLEDDDYLAVMRTTKLIARHIKSVLGSEYVGIKVEGLAVPHAHVHVIPFTTIEEFRNLPAHDNTASDDELATMAQKLAF